LSYPKSPGVVRISFKPCQGLWGCNQQGRIGFWQPTKTVGRPRSPFSTSLSGILYENLWAIGEYARMDNPYESPLSEPVILPKVEVVLRSRWVWRRFEQIYRFQCSLNDPDKLHEKIISFFQHQNTRLISSTNTNFEFERTGTSVFLQLANPSEKFVPQTIGVSWEKTPQGHRVICHYRVRILIPVFLLPPHYLENEARELASECSREGCASTVAEAEAGAFRQTEKTSFQRHGLAMWILSVALFPLVMLLVGITIILRVKWGLRFPFPFSMLKYIIPGAYFLSGVLIFRASFCCCGRRALFLGIWAISGVVIMALLGYAILRIVFALIGFGGA
jgi:hypothetical protein